MLQRLRSAVVEAESPCREAFGFRRPGDSGAASFDLKHARTGPQPLGLDFALAFPVEFPKLLGCVAGSRSFDAPASFPFLQIILKIDTLEDRAGRTQNFAERMFSICSCVTTSCIYYNE